MVVDDRLLLTARARLRDIGRAEQDLAAARAAGRDAVRALHAAGASLREIATELGLSHQRVHQLVAGPGPRQDLLSCSFCGATQAERRKLVVGPDVGICDRCLGPAAALLEAWLAAPMRQHRRTDPAVRVLARGVSCSFCRQKAPRQVPAVAMGLSGAAICSSCLAFAQEIATAEDA